MTIAEKLVTIAEKMQNIYKSGQKSMLDESKIIKKTVTGKALTLDDISEIPHNMIIQLSSDTISDLKNISLIVNDKLYNLTDENEIIVKSQSPYMTISTNSPNVNITVIYNKSWGMQQHYDRFWDVLQNKGKAFDTSYMFSGYYWNDNVYNPKYDIKSTNCTQMFRFSMISDVKVVLDFSNTTGTYVLTNMPKLVRVPKIIVNPNINFLGWFTSLPALEEIRFEGIIGKDLDIHWSTKLSAESYESILDCLSTTSSGQTLTLPTTAEATYDAKHGSGAWAERVKGLTNWEIKYS